MPTGLATGLERSPVEVQQCPLISDMVVEVQRRLLDRELAVEVQQCPLRSEAGEEARRRRTEEGAESYLKI